MADKFIKYEDVLLTIADTDILAESAEIGVEASLQPLTNITGAVIRYAPTGPVRGTLSFSHYCTGTFHDFLNPLTAIEHTGEPLVGSFGGVSFTRGYLRSLSFSLAPYAPILFKSEIDIYGELSIEQDDLNSSFKNNNMRTQTGLAHSLRSYVAGTDLKINHKVAFDYSVSCSRNPSVDIGDEIPSRVTKEDVRINMTIAGEDVGDALSITGNYAALNLYIADVYDEEKIYGTFGCTGQIFNQNLAVREGGYIDGTISVSQEYMTGRVFH